MDGVADEVEEVNERKKGTLTKGEKKRGKSGICRDMRGNIGLF